MADRRVSRIVQVDDGREVQVEADGRNLGRRLCIQGSSLIDGKRLRDDQRARQSGEAML